MKYKIKIKIFISNIIRKKQEERKMNTLTSTSGFEFLPASTTRNNIEIYAPFAKIASEYFANKNLDITSIETGSILISFEKMDINTKDDLLREIKSFLKKSRQEIINNFLIYKGNGISYL